MLRRLREYGNRFCSDAGYKAHNYTQTHETFRNQLRQISKSIETRVGQRERSRTNIYIYIYILQIGILASTTRPLLATDTKLCKTVSVCIVGAARSTLFTACCLCRMRAPHKCILWLAVLSHACVFNIAGDCRPRVRACAKCAYTRQFACNFNIWNMENHDEYIFCELFFTSLFIMVAYFHLLCMFIMRQTHEKISQN